MHGWILPVEFLKKASGPRSGAFLSLWARPAQYLAELQCRILSVMLSDNYSTLPWCLSSVVRRGGLRMEEGIKGEKLMFSGRSKEGAEACKNM